jgi:DNA (cytosine-5)-methyltransferase 1
LWSSSTLVASVALTFGSLFAGIGGFDIALRNEGFRHRWAVEADEYCRRVLQHRFYPLTVYNDVRNVDWKSVAPVDLLCGGFPCQDISIASSTRAGIDGARSGLWRNFRDAIEEVKPKYVIIENSDQLVRRGLATVLSDLAALGYDAEWDRIPAAAVGAPHLRWRLFVVAYSSEVRYIGTNCFGESRRGSFARYIEEARSQWASEPTIRRVAYGVPDWLDRTAALGNAVVPQVVQYIARTIATAHQGSVRQLTDSR